MDLKVSLPFDPLPQNKHPQSAIQGLRAALSCGKLTMEQLQSISQAAGDAVVWAEDKMQMRAVGSRSRQNAAHSEQADRHSRELQSHLEELHQALTSCRANLTSLAKMCPQSLVCLPDLLRMGDVSHHPLQMQQCNLAWHVAQAHLAKLPPKPSIMPSSWSGSSVVDFADSVLNEMCWVKDVIPRVLAALKVLSALEARLKQAAAHSTPAKKPLSSAAACSSGAEYEARLRISTAAAAALLEQEAAEKAAEQLKHARSGKESKAEKERPQASSIAVEKGNPSLAGKQNLQGTSCFLINDCTMFAGIQETVDKEAASSQPGE